MIKRKTNRVLDEDKLLYRRQFVLGPRYLDGFPKWKRISIKDPYFLTIHPDLGVTQWADGDKSITLLGYMLDPSRPKANDLEIVSALAQRLKGLATLDGFFETTYGLGGRWILIVDDGMEMRMFHDPMGLRQVFFSVPNRAGEMWCGSQPGLIAELLGLTMDDRALQEFMGSEVYKSWAEVLWPNNRTPYKEINLLLPNHYLDLRAGSAKRFWPDRPLDRLGFEEGCDKTLSLLEGLIESGSERFGLGFAITAGWDTRLLLAASRRFAKEMHFFSLLRRPNDPDVAVPSRLLKKLGMTHHTIRYPDRMSQDFEKIYRRNRTEGHAFWGRMAEGLYHAYPEDRVCIKGNAGEITRVRFRLPDGREPAAEDLAAFSSFTHRQQMRQIPYVVEAWGDWMSDLGDTHNVHKLDLFYWEYWGGNFAGAAQGEWDIVQEAFTPYNCRDLLITMLGIEEQYRDHDRPTLHREACMRHWPEVLSEPVNPPRRISRSEKLREKTAFIWRPIRKIIAKALSSAN
jgi:hypothetical protein